ADDGAHERGLAAAGGAEEAGDAAAGDGEAEAAQHGAGTPDDGEVLGVDGRLLRGPGGVIHHVMNTPPGGAEASSRRRPGGEEEDDVVRLLDDPVREHLKDMEALLGEEGGGAVGALDEEDGVAADVRQVGVDGDAAAPPDGAAREVQTAGGVG